MAYLSGELPQWQIGVGWAVRRAVMLRGPLPAALDGGAGALSAFGLLVGQPLKPMLAGPSDAKANTRRSRLSSHQRKTG